MVLQYDLSKQSEQITTRVVVINFQSSEMSVFDFIILMFNVDFTPIEQSFNKSMEIMEKIEKIRHRSIVDVARYSLENCHQIKKKFKGISMHLQFAAKMERKSRTVLKAQDNG